MRFYLFGLLVPVLVLVGCGGGGSSSGPTPVVDPPVIVSNTMTAFADPTFQPSLEAGASYEAEVARFFIVAPANEPVLLNRLEFYAPPGFGFLEFSIFINGIEHFAPWNYSGSSESGWIFEVEFEPLMLTHEGEGVAISFMLGGIYAFDLPVYLDPVVYLADGRATGVISGTQYFVEFTQGQSGWLFPPLLDELLECSDGVDNDGDGDIDFPDDLGCPSPEGGSEIGGKG